jgi:AraC-like DNA-binding protein
VEDKDLPLSIHNHIGVLLQQHCIDKQLYLQHDLNIIQLAKAIGTNRFYLSQYFSCQGTTYNEYINHLRIDFFISLYHKAVATHRHYTAQQLAIESGFRSYNTFMRVFKQRMGQNVRKWMDETGQNCSNQQ